MMKKTIASLLMMATLLSGGIKVKANQRFTFNTDDAGFTPIFADYMQQEDADTFYSLHAEHKEVPINRAGKGLYISSANYSADMFMGYIKKIGNLTPGQTYRFTISFKLATNVDGGLIGAGGAPGESVFVKCGIVSIQPQAVLQEDGSYRLNLDKGNQAEGGKDMAVLGDIAKTDDKYPGDYVFKSYKTTAEAVAGEDGSVYLIIGTDSGFEGMTDYYLDNVTVRMQKSNT